MKHLKQSRGFYREIFLLMAPLILQNFMIHSMSLADTFMVGALGETELAALTVTNSFFFVVTLMSFGLQSGASVLVAQYFGRGNKIAIVRVTGCALYVCCASTAAVALLTALFPEAIMGVLTNNRALFSPGAAYMRIAGFSYFFSSISALYCAVLRSMGRPHVGAWLFTASGVLNVFLNWVLIFGHLSFPALGIAGAAIATLISRVMEVAFVAVHARFDKGLPLSPRLLFCPGAEIFGDFIKYALPVVANEVLWSTATSLYAVIMAHMPGSTPILAAYSITGNLDRLVSIVIFAAGNTAAVVTGREIGSGNAESMYGKGVALNFIALAVGTGSAVLILILRFFALESLVFPLLGTSAAARSIVFYMLIVIACIQPVRAITQTNVVGTFRGGGDVRFALWADLLPMYFFSVPLAALAGLVFDLGIGIVYITMISDEFIKLFMCLARLRSRKWINNVTRDIA